MADVATSRRRREEDIRSYQVDSDGNKTAVTFDELLLSPDILKGLTDAGLTMPSPVQLKAIPLGRFGVDLVAQAKNGTGKTCVFSVIALEHLKRSNHSVQVLILTPTRELALQIAQTINRIGKYINGLGCDVFVGGVPIHRDIDKLKRKKIQIAVGTPGRILGLIRDKVLRTEHCNLFILDEADCLLDESFGADVDAIHDSLPVERQTMVFSATFPERVQGALGRFMNNPHIVSLISESKELALSGVRQYYKLVKPPELPYMILEDKVSAATDVLSKVSFQQCVVFVGGANSAEDAGRMLRKEGYPTAVIHGGMAQANRFKAVQDLKDFRVRILVATHVGSRGIDCDRVNCIINLDVPADAETFLHRVGRTGRFGTYGIAVTMISSEADLESLKNLSESTGGNLEALPEEVPTEYYAFELERDEDKEAAARLEKYAERLKNLAEREGLAPSCASARAEPICKNPREAQCDAGPVEEMSRIRGQEGCSHLQEDDADDAEGYPDMGMPGYEGTGPSHVHMECWARYLMARRWGQYERHPGFNYSQHNNDSYYHPAGPWFH